MAVRGPAAEALDGHFFALQDELDLPVVNDGEMRVSPSRLNPEAARWAGEEAPDRGPRNLKQRIALARGCNR